MDKKIIAPASAEIDLSSQIAVVTGANSGMGLATKKLFEKHGATVCALDLVDDDEENNIYHCNIADQENVRNVIDRIDHKFGKIDILVCCAGVTNAIDFEELTSEQWDRTMNINAKGTFFISQAVYRVMKRNNYGKMVHVASIAGLASGAGSSVDYACSKGSVLVLSRYIARIGAEHGIYSNAIIPGPTETPMLYALRDFNKPIIADEAFPMNRKATPEDNAYAILFLASQQSNFITGAYLDTNGGLVMR